MAVRKRHYDNPEMPADKMRGRLFGEDFSKPCGLPYGAHQVECSSSAQNLERVGKATDLYYQVSRTMKEDADAVRSETRPTNW